MIRAISAISTFLVMCSAYADEVKDAPPPETTNVIGIAVFFALFVAMCVGFFGYMWWRHKNNKED